MAFKSSSLYKAFTGLALLTGYVGQSAAVQMLVSPSSNNADNVTLTFFPDATESIADLNNVVCPGGVIPSIKPDTNVSSCEVPNNGTNIYTAAYEDTTLNGTLEQIIPTTPPTPEPLLDPESPEDAVQQGLINACREAKPESELYTRCQEGFANIEETTKAITPNRMTLPVGQLIKISGSQLRTVRSRLNTLQREKEANSAVTLNGHTYSLQGGAAGDESALFQDSALGLFMNGRFQTAQKRQTGYEIGFQADNFGVTAGADYRFTDNLTMGLAFGYDNIDSTVSRGSQDIDAFTGMYYGNFNLPYDMYIDWGAAYSALDISQRWTVNYLKANNTLFTGTVLNAPNADEYELNIGFGKNFAYGSWLVTPHARFDYIELSIDGSKEQGQGGNTGLEFQYASQLARSMTTTAGATVTYALSMPWGVLTPELNFDWQHEFFNDATKIFGSLASVNNVLVARSNAPDRDYFNLSGSLVATFAEGRSVFLSYEARLGQSTVSSHLVQAGIRIPF